MIPKRVEGGYPISSASIQVPLSYQLPSGLSGGVHRVLRAGLYMSEHSVAC